ncbi:MAG: aminopeptidase [Thermoplasmata archaeon]|nr:aminopeptidase [Thermoplasmata archaeon]
MAPPEPNRNERELAQVILSKTLRVRPGDSVTIEAWTHTLGIAKACSLQAVELGARPLIQFHDDASFWRLVEEGHAKTLGALGDHEYAALAKTDAYIFFEGPEDRRRFHALDGRTREDLVSWEWKWWRQAERSGLRCAWVLLGRAVPGSARYFGVDLATWRAELFRASMVEPAVLRRAGTRAARAFQTGKVVRVSHPNGTDLMLRLRRRSVSIQDGAVDAHDLSMGRFMEVVPSGYVPAALEERYAEGEIIANVPGRTMAGGSALSGGHWTFHGGRLVNFSHTKGQNEAVAAYAAAPPDGRDRVGVVSVGLNPEIRIAPYVTDQRAGRLMLLVGGNHFHGGSNPSPFQMYLLLDGATLTVDGRAILRDGKLV